MHPTTPSPTALWLADQLERGFRGGAWHGPSVNEALDGVDAATAAARPIAGAHSIAEITGHLAAWMEVATRRLAGEAVHDIPAAENFPPAAADGEEAWRATLQRLEAAHRALHGKATTLDDQQLAAPVAGSDPTVRGLLLGELQHNAYHAGQIALLARAAGRTA